MNDQQRQRQKYQAAINFGQVMLYMRLYLGVSEYEMIGAFHHNLKNIDKRSNDMKTNLIKKQNETKP